MNWPELWTPVSDSSIAMALEVELNRELNAGHQLFSLSVKIIGSRVDCDDVLVTVLDGSGRVACVHLTWTASSESRTFPYTTLYDSLETWEAEARSETSSDPSEGLE